VTFTKNYIDFPHVYGKTLPLKLFWTLDSGAFAPTIIQYTRRLPCGRWLVGGWPADL